MAGVKTPNPANAKGKKRSILREDVSYQPKAPLQIRYEGEGDNRVGILENVKILGWVSRNKGRKYKPDGVNPALYEGKHVNIDHPDPEDQKKPRPYTARFGWVEGVYKGKEGLFAKQFKFNPKHELAEGFAWWANNRPDAIGFSQNAYGDVYESESGELVDAVTEVRSIDLVSDPATTKGLFEAESVDTDHDRGGEGEGAPGDNDVAEDRAEEVNLEKNAPIIEDDEEDEDDDTSSEDDSSEDNSDSGDAGDSDADNLDTATASEDDDDSDDDATEAESEEDADTAANTGDDMDADPTDDADASPPAVAGVDISDEMASAADKIFRDTSADIKVKLKKIAKLLDLHHGGINEAFMKTEPKTVAEAKANLRKSKAGKAPAVKMVLEALDGHEVAQKLAQKKAQAKKLVKAASLPKEAVTDYFMDLLLECRDERSMQRLIEDRRLVVGTAKANKPKSAGQQQLTEAVGQGKKKAKLTEADMQKNFEAFEASVLAGLDD